MKNYEAREAYEARILKIKTNASTALIVEEFETGFVYILDNEYTNSEKCTIEDVEDWSSWDRYSKEDRWTSDLDEWLGCHQEIPTEILEEKYLY